MPESVSSRFEPVSESDTGKTFIALRAGAESEMIVRARRNQMVNASHTSQPYPAGWRRPANQAARACARDWSGSRPFGYSFSVDPMGFEICNRVEVNFSGCRV